MPTCFSTRPFLNNAIATRGYTFTPVAPTYVLPVGLYSKKITKLSEVHPGTTAAVANDPVNEARGLFAVREGRFDAGCAKGPEKKPAFATSWRIPRI